MIILRAHNWSLAASYSYFRYLSVDKVVVGFDGTSGNHVPDSVATVVVTDDWLVSNGLNIACPRLMWRCGDYNFYRVFESFSNEKYYWLIEPDVLVNWDRPRQFFEEANAFEADFLGLMYGPRGSDWFWHNKIRRFYENSEIHGCSFGILRLSNGVMADLFEGRKKLAERFREESCPASDWPNDESFVTNHLRCSNKRLFELNAAIPGVTSGASYWINKAKGWHEFSEISKVPDSKLYHPVRGFPYLE